MCMFIHLQEPTAEYKYDGLERKWMGKNSNYLRNKSHYCVHVYILWTKKKLC